MLKLKNCYQLAKYSSKIPSKFIAKNSDKISIQDAIFFAYKSTISNSVFEKVLAKSLLKSKNKK